MVGASDNCKVGCTLGPSDDAGDGCMVGASDNCKVGCMLGPSDKAVKGDMVGANGAWISDRRAFGAKHALISSRFESD